jgi:hypothetical protein
MELTPWPAMGRQNGRNRKGMLQCMPEPAAARLGRGMLLVLNVP